MVPRAHFGPIPIGRVEIGTDEPQIRWMREHGTLHIPDVRAQNDFPLWVPPAARAPSCLFPFASRGNSLGYSERTSHRGAPLHPGADQTARNLRRPGGDRIENVRLLLKELESDIQLFDTIAEIRARARLRLVERDKLRLAAHYGPVEPGFGHDQPLTRGSVGGRAVIDRKLIHIEDLMAVVGTEFPEAVSAVERRGGHTVLAAPLLREGVAIGVIFIRRTEVAPFSDKQIKLLETFARKP